MCLQFILLHSRLSNLHYFSVSIAANEGNISHKLKLFFRLYQTTVVKSTNPFSLTHYKYEHTLSKQTYLR